MSLKKIKFGDKEVYKKEFYSSKQAISLDSVDLDKIVVSSKWKINETTYKYLCGYLNNDVIQPLCVILLQIDGYIKYFDNGGKNMTFVTNNEKVYDKYKEIWEVIRKLLKVKFTVNPIRDDRHLVAKLKIFNKIDRTTFNNKNNIPIERNHYICIPAIDIDSVLKTDNKRAYLEQCIFRAYLEQCKCKLKKMKIVNYIDDEIIIMEIVLMNDNAIITTRASKESAGLDLYSSIDVDIEVGSIKKIKYWNLHISSRKFLRVYKR